MALSHTDAQARVRAGMDALRGGSPAEAHRHFRHLIDAGSPLPIPWFLLAQACRGIGDDAGQEDALSRYLEEEPRHLAALLMIAGLKAKRGDDRAAMSFYRTALAVARQPGTDLPPMLMPLLRAGEAFVAAAGTRFAEHLDAQLREAGSAGPRVAQAVDLLLGRRQLYAQAPSMFYFPELSQRQFFERSEFPWLAGLEAATDAIRQELAAVMAEDAAFQPYVTGTPGRPRPANPLLDDPSWGAFHLWQGGRLVEENARRCPATIDALAHAPLPAIAERSPMALFSLLRPGTHIQPHHGMLNTRLICHLPLIVPPDCALRVGNETRAWREGEALIFDDSFEHEAWNRSTTTRVVLLFEIWRPELSGDERAALTRIFEAINDYQGAPVDTGG